MWNETMELVSLTTSPLFLDSSNSQLTLSAVKILASTIIVNFEYRTT